jgi:hypothetical protein
MRSPFAALALAGTLAALPVLAQTPLPGRFDPAAPQVGKTRSAPRLAAAGTPAGQSPAAAPTDDKVFPATATLPAPVNPDQIQAPTIVLPDDPIEPYLLTKRNGPFMVMAKAFRGPDAERFALALAMELRSEYGLPAYILRLKDFPRNGLIRNIPPQAPAGVDRVRLGRPERDRTLDEAAVLVGDEKTVKDQEVLWHRVKKIRPKCLDGLPKLYVWREGLSKATRTTNPFVPAQNLFPGKVVDPIVQRMNDGPHTIYNCPGRYSLQIAEFSGRATFNIQGAQQQGELGLRRSPLVTAHDDAERLASALMKAEEIKRLGQPVYVYHDRTSSRVLIGSFQSPSDPTAAQLRDSLLRVAVGIMDTKADKTHRARRRGIDTMIVPASVLTDLEPIKTN